MLYVHRNANGKITGLSLEPGEKAEAASINDPDVKEFLAESDLDMARVLEDLIALLIKKNIITEDELPESAQLKLLYRRNTRNFLDFANTD